MFDFENNEDFLVRSETYYLFFFTIYLLVKLDFNFACLIYIFVCGSMFAYESADEDIDLESESILSMDVIIPRPYNPDIVDQEDLFGIFEMGSETVTFDETNDHVAFTKFSNLTDSVSKITPDSKDRYKYLWEVKESEEIKVEKKKNENVLKHKLVTANKFTLDELKFVKEYREDYTRLPSWEALKLEKDIFLYNEFMDMVNNYLFQTYIAQGVFPSLPYDFRCFMYKSKVVKFERCKLVPRAKKSIRKKLSNP